jgi:transcriptional repressor NrdR
MCDEPGSQVIDTRPTSDGVALRRRRQCAKCGQRFTTYERYEPLSLMVRKRDGRLEPFEVRKVRLGIEKACSKRAMTPEQITEMARRVEEEVRGACTREVPADHIGRTVMATLREVDEVAYVRFASIHEDFQDAGLFVDAVETLTKQPKSS